MGRLPKNFAPIDTNVFSHPKVRGLTCGAKLLFVAGLLDSNRQMSDGQLKRSDVDFLIGMLGVKKSTHQELLTAGRWRETSTGIEIVGFLKHNKSKVERLAAKEAARERKERWIDEHQNGVLDDVQNGVPLLAQRNRETEIREAEQAAIAGTVA